MLLHPEDDREKHRPDWSRPPEPPLHRAARIGDIEAMAKLLAAGADIDERADLEYDHGPHLKGLTTLMVAARSIDGATVETLRWLVEHGADVRARSQGTNTAAWYAAGHGGRWAFHRMAVTPDHAKRLRLLLDLGLDPNECNFIGRSLLSEACEAGDPARVALLLERGASPTAAGSQAERSLVCAARSGSADCVRLLLEAGANPDERDSLGRTALMVAGSAAVVRVLLAAGAERDATDPYGRDALHAAVDVSCGPTGCEPARFEVAKALVDGGADLGRLDEFGKNRLAVAAFAQQAEGVEILLALGACAGERDTKESTPLHSICWQGEYRAEEANSACERIIRSLVAAGIPLDAVDAYGQTPLHEAAGGDWGNATAIRTLLELGAAPDPRDHAGNTPLMIAAERGEVECIRILLAAGADPKVANEEGRSALDLGLEHLETWRGIVADGPDPTVAEMLRQAHEEVAKGFVGGGAPAVPEIPALMAEQATNHAQALEQAEEAAELLQRTAESSIRDARTRSSE